VFRFTRPLRAADESFLWRIVTGDETWIHHFETQAKKRVEWHHQTSQKKFKATSSAEKVMVTAFWVTERVVLIDIIMRVQTITSDMQVQTLKTFQKRCRRVGTHTNVA